MSLFTCPSCGLPAESAGRFVVDSTDGPVEFVHTRCVQLHRFTLTISSLAEHDEAPGTTRKAA